MSKKSKNQDDKLSELMRRFEEGDAEAAYELAECFEYGHGVEEDLVKSFEYYQIAYEEGYSPAMSKMAEISGEKKYYQVAYEEMKDPDAAFKLGEMEEDPVRAVAYYQSAVEWASHYEATIALAECYENGRGVDKNPEKAFKYYKQAADKFTVSEAARKVAECYERGFGVEQNLVEAKRFYQQALEWGDDDAQEDLDRLNGK